MLGIVEGAETPAWVHVTVELTIEQVHDGSVPVVFAGVRPAGNGSVKVMVPDSEAAERLGVKVYPTEVPWPNVPSLLSDAVRPNVGELPVPLETTTLRISWLSVDPPVDATQPNVIW
jgi:hypothetical protein